MRVIAISTLRRFWEDPDHADAEQPLKAWYAEASQGKWDQPATIKAQYGNASIVGNNRAVFNIAGNKYRLVVAFAYKIQVAYVKFIGTHAAYDQIDAATVEPD